MSYLSKETKSLLVNKTYALGSVHTRYSPNPSPVNSYEQERNIEQCTGGKGVSKNTSKDYVESSTGCRVWSGNSSTWTGQVALMYPSDYGLSASETNWTKSLEYGDTGTGFEDAAVNATTWMYSTMADSKIKSIWTLSPSTDRRNYVAVNYYDGHIGDNDIYYYGLGVRPVLYLSSKATRLEGDGTLLNPYRLFKKEEKLTGLAKTIVNKAYSNENEMIAIDVTDKNNIKKCASVEACAGKEIEYRYIGPTVNNYIYLKDNNDANELWRIIGVFFNELNEGWSLKVVRDEVLKRSYFPDTYVINQAYIDGSMKKVTYSINSTAYVDSAYWNKNDSKIQLNRWEEAGLQYWLNTERGYLKYLSPETKALLVNQIYTLGTIHASKTPYDTPKLAYKHERDVENCINGKGPSTNNSQSVLESEKSGCHVWSGNSAKWKGKVALMYPSDYGLSASEANWTTQLTRYGFSEEEVNGTSWMWSTMADSKSKDSWFLSPSSTYSYYGLYWYEREGFIGEYGVMGSTGMYSTQSGVRPVLYLWPSVSRINGSGTSESPYVILN